MITSFLLGVLHNLNVAIYIDDAKIFANHCYNTEYYARAWNAFLLHESVMMNIIKTLYATIVAQALQWLCLLHTWYRLSELYSKSWSHLS